MEFINALKTCIFKKYFKTEGRASRSEFWYFVIFYFGVIALSIILFPHLEEMFKQPFTAKNDYSIIWTFLFGLAFIFPLINVTVRRLHDINQSGLYWMGAVVGFLILAKVFSDQIVWIGILIYFIILILCLKKGDKKDNMYGKNIYKKSKKV